MIAETLIGSLTGGLFRMAPEILRHFDRKNERKHELSMFEKQVEADKQRSALHIQEVQAQGQVDLDTSWMDTYNSAIKAQGQLTGNAWIDGINQLVRPTITYWLLALYATFKVAGVMAAWETGGLGAIMAAYTIEDHAMLSGVIAFWFVDRSIIKGR